MSSDAIHRTKLRRLRRVIGAFDNVVIAFSGGVDSTLVLAVAVAELGPDQVIAATAVSPSLPHGALERAARLAGDLGATHRTVSTAELQREEYVRNDRRRCAACKSALLDALDQVTNVGGDRQVLTGANADDLRDPFRPGVAAATARGARHPLAEVGMTKQCVRAASRELLLPTWDQPAAPCLASRIAYGVAVTAPGLRRVGAAEEAVRRLSARAGVLVRDLRVRDLGADVARIDVDAELVISIEPLLPAIRAEFIQLGFAEVALDPRGFRSGSLNDRETEPRPR